MASLSSDPGLVWLRPRSVIAPRSAASRRSIVAGEIATSRAAVSSLTSSSPNRRSRGARSEQNRSPAATSGP